MNMMCCPNSKTETELCQRKLFVQSKYRVHYLLHKSLDFIELNESYLVDFVRDDCAGHLDGAGHHNGAVLVCSCSYDGLCMLL